MCANMKTKKLTKKQISARVDLLGMELKKMEERLAEQQKPLLEKMEKVQELIDRMEKVWKIPVDYHELVALSKKFNAQQEDAMLQRQ